MSNMLKKEVSEEEKNILIFVDAVDKDRELEFASVDRGMLFVSTNSVEVKDTQTGKVYQPNELFVLKDNRYEFGSECEFPKVEVKEVMEKCTSPERAQHLIGILKGEKNSIILQGITRIVGYYSRVNSWNKSKIGELRDRGQGGYKLGKEGNANLSDKTESQERHSAISSL